MNVKNDADQLVEDYLHRLAKAADPLPEGRRTELISEVAAHIAEARAEGAVSESEVREMLARLGSPDDIVAAATDGLVLVDRFRTRDAAALLFLAFGGFLFLGGWLIGVALLWSSNRWTKREKWLGTLIWPFGYAFVGFLLKFSVLIDIPDWLAWATDMPVWLARAGWLVIFVSQTAIIAMLFRNARPGRSKLA